MDTLHTVVVPPGSSYGPIQSGFAYDIRRGYTALVGVNNAGKSALLQLIFRTLFGAPTFGRDAVCLILSDRERAQNTSQPGDRSLSAWNQELSQAIGSGPLQFGPGYAGPDRSELARLLLHRELLRQMGYMQSLLPRLGLPTVTLSGAQEWSFEALSIVVQGSGLRSAFPILAAETDPGIKTILIDEPELSLEPRLQKALRDILVAKAHEPGGPVIIVATHSHLFLNREQPESTQVVERVSGITSVRDMATQADLAEVTFKLLGNSTEDLFFPRNYIVVEGASDQEIVSKVLELLGTPVPRIKVLSAGGMPTVKPTLDSVRRALVPLYVDDSPYAKRVVALIDKPRAEHEATVAKLRTHLGDRLFVLDVPEIEEYLPAELYTRSGRSKDEELARIERVRHDYSACSALKREISHELAEQLTIDDLRQIPLLQQAAQRAIEASNGG